MKGFRMRHMSDMELVDAERAWILYAGANSIKVDDTKVSVKQRRAFMAGLEIALGMVDGAKARERFQTERFARAFMLAGQLYKLLTQCLMVLNNIRKRIVVGPEEKPADTLGIGQTIEVVASALKSAKTILLTLDAVQPDANGNPTNER